LTRTAQPISFAFNMFRLPFELLLALRYLRPKRTFVSVITLISVLGVALGVAVLIIVISVMSGFDHQLRERLLGFNSHLKVFEDRVNMKDYPAIARRIATNSEVKAVAPLIMGPVLIETQPASGSSKVAAPYLRGMDPTLEGSVSVLPQSIVEGKFDVKHQGVLVGIDLAASLNLSVGDRLLIYSPNELRKLKEKHDKGKEEGVVPDEYEVRGIFDVGYYEYNSSVIVADLEDAQDLYVLKDRVHGLLVMLKDPYRATEVKQQLAKALGPDFTIKTWMEENQALLGALAVEKNVMFYILFFIMIVAALCILSALITFVVQKTREIGMLKALGATDVQVAGLFLSQSGFVGVVGVLSGFGLGMLALAYRNEFLHFMNRMTGFELFPASIYGFNELPAIIAPRDIIIICGSALVICLMGGVIPAWRAGRLKPVEALRHE
jgi:lipoprotein-releasing system permease protein